MAATELHALRRDQIGAFGKLLPPGRATLRVQLIEPLHILSIRMLPGGAEAVAGAVHSAGVPSLPVAGHFTGEDPMVLWRNPTELLLVTQHRSVSDSILSELPPAAEASAYAVDQSDGLVAFELRGSALGALLPRLMDASAVPLEAGRGVRARLADIAVIAMRLDTQCAWLIADRANDQYLAQWVAYATDALDAIL